MYRDWWNLRRPVEKEPPMIPRLKQMTHSENNSSLGAEFLIELDQLSSPLCRNLGRIHIIANLDKLIAHFENGQVIAVSDASISDDGYIYHTLILWYQKMRNIDFMALHRSITTKKMWKVHALRNPGCCHCSLSSIFLNHYQVPQYRQSQCIVTMTKQ